MSWHISLQTYQITTSATSPVERDITARSKACIDGVRGIVNHLLEHTGASAALGDRLTQWVSLEAHNTITLLDFTDPPGVIAAFTQSPASRLSQ